MNSQTIHQVPGSDDLSPARSAQAFTRLELAAVLGALGLVALLAVPSLANQRERSARVQCVNNLRLAGQAFEQWGTEHGGRVPWRTPSCEGGTQVGAVGAFCPTPPWLGLQGNSWFQWSWISNELITPKILVCPSDVPKRPASNWSQLPNGGFLSPTNQNHAVSYLLGLDVLPEHRDGLVAGDRNLRFSVVSSSCSSGIVPCRQLSANGGFGIIDGLHAEAGNFLFKDGRVEELSTPAFIKRILTTHGFDGNGSTHYLAP